MTDPILPTPEERAAAYKQWHDGEFEKIPFEPKPKEFLPKILYFFNAVWSELEVNRRVKRIFFWGILLFVLVASLVMSYGEDLMAPRASHVTHQIAAGIFLIAVILNFIFELGFRGGDKNR